MRRFSVLLILAAMFLSSGLTVRAHAEARAYGRQWGGIYSNRDWERFYHYPYVYYPHNYWGQEYFKSSDSLYYRYPNEMRIPVYNKKWHNFYPSCRPYHQGHHFVLDIF